MSPHYDTNVRVADLLFILFKYRRRWLLPAILIGGLSCLYAAVKRDRWEASQAVRVRKDAASHSTAGALTGPGEFRLEDEMKVAQETVLEIARSRPVLMAALAAAGPPQGAAKEHWPAETDADELLSVLKVAPPKGAEFGTTEIFFIKLRDRQRDRAARLLECLCTETEHGLGRLRDARAGGTAAELEQVVSLASADFDRAKQRLADLERNVGSNLVELRMLEQSPAGVSDLNRQLTEAENEVRQARGRQSLNHGVLKLVRDAQDDLQLLVTAPPTLLEVQPNLKRLADGLVDAQLKTSSYLGVMTERHPQVATARKTEETIRQKIFSELTSALRSIEADNQLADSRVEFLEERLAELRGRISEVAAMRVEYASLNSDVTHRRSVLEAAERQLADARASQAVATKCGTIDRIGVPDTGSRPVGPGRTLIALIGIAGGLMAGLGILVLTVPVAAPLRAQPWNGNHRDEDAEPVLAGNGHSHSNDLLKNRFASSP